MTDMIRSTRLIIFSLGLIIILTSGFLMYEKGASSSKEDSYPVYNKEIGSFRYDAQIENHSKKVLNNVWGLTDKERSSKSVKSYIYYNNNGSFGWEWDRPNPTTKHEKYVPPIYPEVIVGEQPSISSANSSTTPYFPIKVKDISDWTVDLEYNYTEPAIGAYNLAYDIYFVDAIPVTQKKSNIMIWMQGNLAGHTSVARISDGTNDFEYYYRNDFPWPWHAFILKNQNSAQTHYTINIKKLLDILIQSGQLEGGWYVPGIELGNEIWNGSGRIEISKFDVNLNGNKI